MSYDLTIQFDDEATATTDSASVESFLQSYHTTNRVDRNQWIHEPSSSIHVEIALVPANEDDPDTINSIGVGVPYPLLSAAGEPALLLCFALAQHLGWRVFDEQVGDYVDPADMRELLAGQAEFVGVANEVLGADSWLDQWATAAKRQNLLSVIVVIGLAALGAVVIFVQLDVQDDRYLFWIGLPIALVVFTIKILLDAWVERRRRSRN